MSQRRKNPALYELLGSRPINKPGAVHPPTPDPVDDEDTAFGIKPGRTIRVPMGYLFFAIAGVVALIFSGYMLGYHQRDRLAEQEKLRMLTGNPDVAGIGSNIADPLANGTNRGSGDSGRATNRVGGSSGGESTVDNTSRPSGSSNADRTGSPLANVWFVRDGVSDPRTSGLNYYILASNYPWDEAEKAALFLGQNGVGTVVFPSGRRDRWNLSTRQGFAPGDLGDAEAQSLVSRVKEVGRRYQSQERGATDFDDLWPAKLN